MNDILPEQVHILNVAFLNRHGVKISHIAALSRAERDRRVKEVADDKSDPDVSLNALKLAMLSYDASDPSWSYAGPNTKVHNWIGPMGAKAADLLFQTFGLAALI